MKYYVESLVEHILIRVGKLVRKAGFYPKKLRVIKQRINAITEEENKWKV